MATVYLAHDLKHERKVALKVLKPELAAVVGGDRFLAEIKTTANLQHPHILPLYDSGEADSFLYYVMPYVQGETLRDRIDREKQLPVEDAVRIAVAVGNALDYAHRHGVVHRDIKPGNILIQDGQPVVGDFGIALAVGSAGGARLTETGLSVGTPFYMSPEQATGDMGVGPASDIYALAAVLYEMLTGEPPYTGTTAQAVLGRIIQGTPVSATAIRQSVPAHVDAAIRKGLEKLPADRFKGAQEFASALQDPAFRHGEERAAATHGGSAGPWKWVAAAAILATLGLSAALVREMTEPEPVRALQRFADPFLPDDQLVFTGPAGFDLSRDGTAVVYRHIRDQGQILMIRRWDELAASPVRETGAASNPAMSRSGTELAFDQNGDVKVLAIAGGPVRTVLAGIAPEWGPRDEWIYASGDSGIVRAPSGGGAVERLTLIDDANDQHFVSDILPRGRRMLYNVIGGVEGEMRIMNLEAGESTSLGSGFGPRYVPPGYLLYLTSEGSLMAVGFDEGSGEMVGTPVALLDDVGSFAVADDGTLFYSVGADGAGVDQLLQLIWVTRDGQAEPIDPDWTFVRGGPDTWWEVSPDGTRLALREMTADGNDIWIKQLPDGPRSRLTFGEADDWMPSWGPEPGDITFTSDRDGNLDVWVKSADGTGEPRLILDFERDIATYTWSPDREYLVIRTAGPRGSEGSRDIYAFRPGVDSVPQPLLAAPGYDEMYPQISPDGRWLAYQTTETDRHEIYVRPFPDVNGGRWQVSVDGGRNPMWSPDGTELFFQGPNREMMAVDVGGTGSFQAGTPRVLFETEPEWVWGDILGNIYDVTPDGERFVLAMQVDRNQGGEERPDVILVNNFLQEIRARVSR